MEWRRPPYTILLGVKNPMDKTTKTHQNQLTADGPPGQLAATTWGPSTRTQETPYRGG
ncbi:hypothetical protein PCASD_16934 [Puccinia coronata f. sp. avenae]|uniref:Uncharacterized protein n=1 Tax=Puccinia coronata f. sp. avenae TaxID=200324 RepID=A0A2N5T4X6_9BASI|nr:hypothetical protein PCASD_16934 [Puccinia coronata f. sp. avenae]